MKYRILMKAWVVILLLAVPLLCLGMENNSPRKKEQLHKMQTLQAKAKSADTNKTVSAKSSTNKSRLAPDFELLDIHQDTVTLGDYKNKQPLILFFWTTWCPFCQKELSVLNDMYASLVQDDFEVLAINVGESTDTVNTFLDSNSYNLMFRVLLDQDTKVATSYNLMGVPTYIVVNKKGEIVFQDNSFPSAYKDLVS